MIFCHFSAFAYAESETIEKIYRFQSGSFEPSETSLSTVPREIRSRSFLFAPLLYLSIKEIIAHSPFNQLNLEKSGILCGSFTAGGRNLQEQFLRYNQKGLSKVSPLTVPSTIYNSASSVLAIAFGCQNISAGYHCAETSGVAALCDAIQLIAAGVCDNIFVCAGEDLPSPNNAFGLSGGAVLISKNYNECKVDEQNSIYEVSVLVNRGKPYLSPQENLDDALSTAIEKIESPLKFDNWLYLNYQDNSILPMVSNINILKVEHLLEYRSLSPFLAAQIYINRKMNFKLLVISSESHAVILEFKRKVF